MDGEPNTRSIVVFPTNPPWVRSLCAAMPPETRVYGLRLYSPWWFVRATRLRPSRLRAWESVGASYWERYVLIPDAARHPTAAAMLVSQVLTRLAARVGPLETLVCTDPYVAGAMAREHAARTVYYPYDAFEFYEWDRGRTRAAEEEALRACDVTLAMAKQLVVDFSARTARPVRHSPQALSQSFIDALHGPAAPRPADLASVRGRIVGCVGTLNKTTDWGLVDALVDAFPTTTFVFVGAVTRFAGTDTRRIHRSLSKPNVRWVGHKPHDQLPAYLRAFDVCLCPLRPDEHSHRRCPLRLYDYMATDKPILSTALREADSFDAFIARDQNQARALLAHLLSADATVDLDRRRTWLAENTWAARARQFLTLIDEATSRP